MSDYETRRDQYIHDQDLDVTPSLHYVFEAAENRIAELEAGVQHQVERREEEKLRAVNAEAERDKWEWAARDACRELAYETHVNPQSPLDYRLANWRPRKDGQGK